MTSKITRFERTNAIPSRSSAPSTALDPPLSSLANLATPSTNGPLGSCSERIYHRTPARCELVETPFLLHSSPIMSSNGSTSTLSSASTARPARRGSADPVYTVPTPSSESLYPPSPPYISANPCAPSHTLEPFGLVQDTANMPHASEPSSFKHFTSPSRERIFRETIQIAAAEQAMRPLIRKRAGNLGVYGARALGVEACPRKLGHLERQGLGRPPQE